MLKIYVCDVNKSLLSMKVKYVYVIQNRKYTGGTVQGGGGGGWKHCSGHILSVLSLYQRYFCIVYPQWNTFSNIFNFTCMVEINNLGVCIFSFLPIVFISKHAIHN